jgi:hypothetical protein
VIAPDSSLALFNILATTLGLVCSCRIAGRCLELCEEKNNGEVVPPGLGKCFTAWNWVGSSVWRAFNRGLNLFEGLSDIESV